MAGASPPPEWLDPDHYEPPAWEPEPVWPPALILMAALMLAGLMILVAALATPAVGGEPPAQAKPAAKWEVDALEVNRVEWPNRNAVQGWMVQAMAWDFKPDEPVGGRLVGRGYVIVKGTAPIHREGDWFILTVEKAGEVTRVRSRTLWETATPYDRHAVFVAKKIGPWMPLW